MTTLERTPTPVSLQSAAANERLDHLGAHDIVRWAVDRFGPRLCVATSFADTVLLDVVMAVDPSIPVYFADTGFHFAETLDTMKRAQVRYRLDLRVIRPGPAAADLWATDVESCCAARKVTPLLNAMAAQGFKAWLTGLRRAESPSRTKAPVLVASPQGLTKIAPLVHWSDEQVDVYQAKRNLITNPLIEQGYPSIGCWPCTQPAAVADRRSGRWVGSTKTECGLHPAPSGGAGT